MKYLVNTSEANVSLNDNAIYIARGDFIEISDEESQLTEVIAAVRKKWVKVQNIEPVGMKAFEPKLEFENAKPQGSTTLPGKTPVVAAKKPATAKPKTKKE